jgi:hypothetical protein
MNARQRIERAAFARGPLACAAFALVAGFAPLAQAQSPPDWKGFWIGEGLAAEISGFPGRGANYKLLGQDAPWSEEGRKRVEATRARQADSKANGWGFPLMMNSAAPLQFLITPDETLIINVYRDVRHVYTDGRSLPAEEDRWPTTWGESVGRWEGDTLVIDTVSVRNPNRYSFSSPPLSEEAHYVERLRMTGPDRIESVMTITDLVTLTEPWVVNLAYERAAGLDRLMHDDYDNDRSEVEGGFFTIEPPQE